MAVSRFISNEALERVQNAHTLPKNNAHIYHALQYYNGTGAWNINRRLRNSDELCTYTQKHSKALDAAMKPLPEDMVLLRGIRLPQAIKLDEPFHDLGYLSCTSKLAIARNFSKPVHLRPHGYVLVFNVPAGIPYVALSKHMSGRMAEREQEIVLGRGLIFTPHEHVKTYQNGVQLIRASLEIAQ